MIKREGTPKIPSNTPEPKQLDHVLHTNPTRIGRIDERRRPLTVRRRNPRQNTQNQSGPLHGHTSPIRKARMPLTQVPPAQVHAGT